MFTMTTGYQNSIVAEARQRLRDVLEDISNIIKLQTQAQDSTQYNVDPSTILIAARQDILALSKDFDVFKKFINDNRDKLFDKEYEYYNYKFDTIQRQIDFFVDTIMIPTVASPIPTGVSANDTAVGAAFTGTIVMVTDGDTVVVEPTSGSFSDPGDDSGRPSVFSGTAQVVNSAGVESPSSPELSDKQIPPAFDDSGSSLPGGKNKKLLTIRLAGIDCPEGGTSRGKMVTKATSDFWLNKDVMVYYDRHTPNDMYGRVLGTIYWNDINFSIWSLEHCYTSPNLKFAKNHYVDDIEYKQAVGKCLQSWPQIGVINVTSKPSHASVHIGSTDEELKVLRGNTPVDVQMPIGDHVLIISSPGCSTIRDVIEVTSEKKKLPTYILSKSSSNTGLVDISTDPFDASAIISIDDVPVSLSPVMADLPLTPPSKITVVADGYVTDERSVTPVIGKITKIVVSLKKS